jgi:hypothetical protein
MDTVSQMLFFYETGGVAPYWLYIKNNENEYNSSENKEKRKNGKSKK